MIQFTIKNKIGHILFNSPPGNQINLETFGSLEKIFESVKDSGALKGIIIEGKGRHFSEGSDTKSLFNLANRGSYKPFKKNLDILMSINKLPIPSIAILKGVCLGSGLELAMQCDYRFGIEKTTLSLPETGFNLIPGLGGLSLLYKTLTPYQLFEFVLKDQSLNGEQAHKIGIIDHLSIKKNVIFDAEDFIQSITPSFNRSLKKVYLDRFIHLKH